MVLGPQGPGRVGRRRFFVRGPPSGGPFFCPLTTRAKAPAHQARAQRASRVSYGRRLIRAAGDRASRDPLWPSSRSTRAPNEPCAQRCRDPTARTQPRAWRFPPAGRALGFTGVTQTCGAGWGWPSRCRGLRSRPSRSGARHERAPAGSLQSTSQSTQSSSSSVRNERVSRYAASARCASANVRHEGNMCSQATEASGWTAHAPSTKPSAQLKNGSTEPFWSSEAATRIAFWRRREARWRGAERPRRHSLDAAAGKPGRRPKFAAVQAG
jgi:hypothetical protein